MPANLTPEYKAAETAYRQARDPKERLECLREMLRTMPKHKGTDHLQAEIKTRIRELTAELTGPKKGGAHGGPATVVRPEGAAQLALLGPPNVGKSLLHARLTGSSASVGPYPFTTRFPQPGMLPFEDVALQLVDLPAIAPGHPVPWLAAALQPADAALLVIDLGAPDCVDRSADLHDLLRERRVTLSARWPFGDQGVSGGRASAVAGARSEREPSVREAEGEAPAEGELDDPFAIRLPTLLLANQCDRLRDPAGELEVFRELTGLTYPAFAVSAETGAGLGELAPWLFRHLGVVRVYTKAPGRPPDNDRPFTLRRGQTVLDAALLVHKDLAESLKYARLWREGEPGGLHIGRDHPIADGDVIELHT
jgi:hypothetical protein